MVYEIENELGDIRAVESRTYLRTNTVKPLVTGDLAPYFGLSQAPNHWIAQARPHTTPAIDLSIFDLLNERPLVVSFYCPCWGAYARPFLNGLIRLYPAIQQAGAELVVFSNESPRSVDPKKKIEFLLTHDVDFQVAKTFGLYSEEDPIWDRISGISADVYTPGLYVVDTNRRIKYHFVDENFDQRPDEAALIHTIHSLQKKKTANPVGAL